MSVDIRKRVDDLLGYMAQGRVLDAMDEFYAENSSMQENGNPPTVGRAANIEREKEFLAAVKEWKGFEVKAVAVEGNVAFIETTGDFVHVSGADVHMEQVSVQRWENGMIVHERFYYDGAH